MPYTGCSGGWPSPRTPAYAETLGRGVRGRGRRWAPGAGEWWKPALGGWRRSRSKSPPRTGTFAVYVITPTLPEGEPASDCIQAILRCNRLTMEMMYGIIMEAIDAAGYAARRTP